jgi:uncharacterized protein (DUF4415 family)
MDFEWSEAKRIAVLEARGLDFIDADILFDGRALYTVASPRVAEERWLTVGELNGRFIAVIWTRRNQTIRIITMREPAMMKRNDTVRFSAEQLEGMRRRGESRTDWARVDAMTEDELEASIAADPDDVHEEPDWTKAVLGLPPRKEHINIRIDADVLSWFKQTGRGWQTRMNNVLRAFVESRRHTAGS